MIPRRPHYTPPSHPTATPFGQVRITESASSMRGVPLSVIQQLMGHDDPRTTSIYTVAHAEDLSAALADAGAL
jgi:integrase